MRGRLVGTVAAIALAVAGLGMAGTGVSGATAPTSRPWSAAQVLAAARASHLRGLGRLGRVNASAAGPVPVMTVHDATGDVPDPQGDITAAGFAQNSSQFAFGVEVADPVDPATDPAWQAGGVDLEFALDRNNDGNPDYLVVVVEIDASDIETAVLPFSNPGAGACPGSFAYIAGSGYRATFPNHCLPGGMRFRFEAAMAYSADPNNENPPVDFAPSDSTWSAPLTTVAAPAPSGPAGYWMLGADGRVYGFGNAIAFPGITPHAAAMSGRKDGKGYWIVDTSGHVFAFGTAHNYGGSPGLMPGERITTMSTTKTQAGYWLFSNRGRAFAYGDASSYGDMSGTRLNGPVIASVASAGGHGYYMVASDGGIFGFGDARFYGSTGNLRLRKPVVGISPTPDSKGYWLVGADGGVFSFGDAPFRGSMGNVALNQPVEGIVAYGNGYLMGAADGGVFNFSNRPFVGSLATRAPSAPIIGLAAFAG